MSLNRWVGLGRATNDADARVTQDGKSVARYTLAVNRRDRETADFIPCVCFGKSAEFAEKYITKGIKLAVEGRIQTGSYTKADGTKVYTTEIIVDTQEFAESKTNGSNSNGFNAIDIELEDEELPFA